MKTIQGWFLKLPFNAFPDLKEGAAVTKPSSGSVSRCLEFEYTFQRAFVKIPLAILLLIDLFNIEKRLELIFQPRVLIKY